MTEKTIFEKIIDREVPAEIIYEDQKNIAFLNAFPFENGHILVIPKKAYVTIFDMPEKEFLDLQLVIYKVAKNVREKTGKDIAIYQRNGPEAGQEVQHVHFHIVPRYQPESESPLFNDIAGEMLSNENKKEFGDLLKML